MSARISIDQAYEPVEVDLWGEVYNTRPLTKSVAKKAAGLEADVEKLEDGDEVVKALASLLDIYLVSTNGKRTKPSTIVVKKWNADDLSLPQLTTFVNSLVEGGERPT